MSFVRSLHAPKNSEPLSLVFSAAAQDGCNAPDGLACLQPFTLHRGVPRPKEFRCGLQSQSSSCEVLDRHVARWNSGAPHYVVHQNTHPIYFALARLTQSRLRIVMAPPVRFQADHLSYDSVANKLRGQSWSHVEFCSNLKHLLAGSCCYANDDRTKIFFCGGTRRVNGYFDSAFT